MLGLTEGLNDWVAGVVKMFSRVTVWRGVAASYVAACQAEAQLYPGRTDFQAVLAASGMWCNRADVSQMWGQPSRLPRIQIALVVTGDK